MPEPTRHEAMKFFFYGHLGIPKLADTQKCFRNFAMTMDAMLPDGGDKDVFFDQLLKARDAANRAILTGAMPKEIEQ